MAEPGASARGIAATTMVETAEGPVAMADTPGKGFAVLTRLPSGQLGFRQLIKVVTAGPVPLVRVVLNTGQVAVTTPAHPFYRQGMERVSAEQLNPGDVLDTAYHYPPGYRPPNVDPAKVWDALSVRAIEPAGEGQVLTGTVRETHVLFLTAGVLCGE